jgi:hypothetical protein
MLLGTWRFCRWQNGNARCNVHRVDQAQALLDTAPVNRHLNVAGASHLARANSSVLHAQESANAVLLCRKSKQTA